jgi:hypothetical protein
MHSDPSRILMAFGDKHGRVGIYNCPHLDDDKSDPLSDETEAERIWAFKPHNLVRFYSYRGSF